MIPADEDFLAKIIATVFVILIVVGIFVAMIPFMLLQAWSIAVLLSWFAVPVGFPVLGIPRVMGLVLIVRSLQSAVKKEKDVRPLKEKVTGFVIDNIVVPFLMVGIGFTIKHFGGL